MRSRAVTIGQLRDHLSAELKRVRAGAELVVMDRNTPVAKVVRYAAPANEDTELGELVREGVLRAPRGSAEKVPRAPVLRKNSLLDALLANREEER